MTESQECLSITFGEAVEFAVSETRPRPTDRSEVTAQDRPYQSAGSRLIESISSELRRPSPAVAGRRYNLRVCIVLPRNWTQADNVATSSPPPIP